MIRRIVYVARHGETDWNAQARWQGHSDVPLNDTGRAQARALAETLRRAGLAALVASDLSRALETARIVGTELGLAMAYVDAGFRERAVGIFEGLTRQECETLHPAAWREWLERKLVPPGGEAHDALASRVVAAVGRVAMRVAREDAPALVVTHGGVMRAIVAAATGELPPPVANGAVWRVAWEGMGWPKQGDERDGRDAPVGRIAAAEEI